MQGTGMCLTGLFFEDACLLHQALAEVVDRIDRRKVGYNCEFRQAKLFDVFLIDFEGRLTGCWNPVREKI